MKEKKIKEKQEYGMIPVYPETKRILDNLRYEYKCKSFDALINKLLDKIMEKESE